MSREHIVVDGSNIATEGRSAPSLAQLEEAVSELRREYPDAEVTVIVDATFSHRIDPSELARFEEATLQGEYAHPPAGAIGRGDAFLLRIAERVDATVLSNDSFQEFHGEHPWLFERGRLLGATPVPGIGWIFSPRTPVRGPKSRRAVKDQKATDDKAKRRISKAIEAATKEAVAPKAKTSEPAGASGRKRRGAVTATAVAVNDPLTFVSFIADHPLGTEVTGEVENYTSHGAVVMVDSTQCYLPLANMAVPAPRSAREIVKKKERRGFVVVALDPQRRGVELAIPGVAAVSGRPSEETIAAELRLAKKKAAPKKAPAKKAAAKRTAKAEPVLPGPPSLPEEVAPAEAPAAKATPRRRAKKAAEPVSPESRAAEPAEAAEKPAQPAKKAPAKKAAPRRKSSGKEPSPAGGEGAVKEAASSKKAPARKAAAKRSASSEGASPGTAASPATETKAPRKKAAPKKTAATKSAAKKAPAKKAPAKKSAAESPSETGEGEGPAAPAAPRRRRRATQ